MAEHYPAGGTKMTVLSGATDFFMWTPSASGTHSLQISWADATSSAALTLESSNYGKSEISGTLARATNPGLAMWALESGVSITGPAASAANSVMVHLSQSGAKSYRVKIVAAADTVLWFRPHGK